MELIVFDLDGTLLNGDSVISSYTEQTLRLLENKGIAYTVATGRTLHGSRSVLEGQGFGLPQAFKNGVMIWHPSTNAFSHRNILTPDELTQVSRACHHSGVTPFIFTLESGDQHAVYYAALKTEAEKRLETVYLMKSGIDRRHIDDLGEDAEIINVSSIGERSAIERVADFVADEPHLVAYSGPAYEGMGLYWIDIHHSNASKGQAIETLRDLTGAQKVICFGDSDNDLSMFEAADECFAPENAKEHIKTAATAVIGHHDEEGIARFLRERFDL